MKKHAWLLLLMASGCLGAGEEALETTAEEIRGGIERAEPGVVGMWIGGGFCSASLIADDALVTAATCKSGTADPQIIRVVELEASGSYRCLTARTDVVGGPTANMETVAFMPGCLAMPARFFRAPGTDEEDNFMVMRLVSDRWFGKNRDEFVRLLAAARLEHTNGLHTTTADDFYMAFGAASEGMGQVRMRSGIWEVVDDEARYMNLEASESQGVCRGDIGGPVGFHNLGDPIGLRHRYVVAGVMGRAEFDDSDCAEDEGDNQMWTRISRFIPTIGALLGRQCRRYDTVGPDAIISISDCDNSIACVGETPDGASAWQVESPNSISLTVNTASCGYDTTPLYFPTLLGSTHHWRAMGTTSVFQATATGFKVIVTDRGGTLTPPDANARHWRIGWHAVRPAQANPSGCSGKTTPGATAWQTNSGPGGGIFLDINTTVCGFTEAPTYIASLGGTAQHHRTTGVSSAYNATATGFRVFIHGQDGLVVTPTMANANNWHVNWLAEKAAVDTEYCAGSTPTTGWVQVGSGPTRGLTRTIDISGCGLTVAPRILTSFGGNTMHWNTTGATSIYDVTPTSFGVFIYDESGTVTPGMAFDRGWHIDFAVRR